MKEVTSIQLEDYSNQYENNKNQNTLRRVLFRNKLDSIFEKQEIKVNTRFLFSHEIKTLPVTNQRQSGRCWIFAGLNVLREVIAKKYNLDQFELSQNYIAFWDKFEKINYFIESIDDFLLVDKDDRTLQHIIKTGIQDGGQWDMFVSLVLKYGVIPKDQMIETASSESTAFMNRLINVKLRKYVAEARHFAKTSNKEAIDSLKEDILSELFMFLQSNFGIPPKTIDFEFKNKDGYQLKTNIKPLDFYHNEIGNVLEDYVSIINSPTDDKPFLSTFTVAYLGNVVGGKDILHLNLEMTQLKDLVVKQLKNSEVVWFGADVSRFGDRVTGVWDDQLFDFENVLEMNLTMSKENQLDYSQSAMNHAMVITGVNLVDDKPNRFKIENSWGSENGEKGYYVGSNSWFDNYVFQAVINKKYLSEIQLKAVSKKAIVLKPWDPMGSLAK